MHTYNQIKMFIKKEKPILLVSVIIGFLLMMVITSITKSYSHNIQNSISEEVIRFHVLANSDSDFDQELKLKVKNEVINMLAKDLDSSTSKAETVEILSKNLSNIEQKALEIIEENGYDYPVSVSIGDSYFPTKTYGNISLPAGEYEALKIEIGSASGQNWWCVMFPPLCFVDVTVNEIPEKDANLLKNILTDEEYKLISEDSPTVQVKFKIVEFFNKPFFD